MSVFPAICYCLIEISIYFTKQRSHPSVIFYISWMNEGQIGVKRVIIVKSKNKKQRCFIQFESWYSYSCITCEVLRNLCFVLTRGNANKLKNQQRLLDSEKNDITEEFMVLKLEYQIILDPNSLKEPMITYE